MAHTRLYLNSNKKKLTVGVDIRRECRYSNKCRGKRQLQKNKKDTACTLRKFGHALLKSQLQTKSNNRGKSNDTRN